MNNTSIIKIVAIIVIIIVLILLVRYGFFVSSEDVDDNVNRNRNENENVNDFYSKKGDSDYIIEGDTLEPNSSFYEASAFEEEIDEIEESVSTFESIEESGIKRSKGEQECKQILQKIFKKKFVRIRPSWLKNPETGYPLELDLYNEELNIALEYNGIQHYKWPNFTGQSEEEHLAQKRRDKFKKQKCKEFGIKLIIIKYHTPIKELEREIIRKLYNS